MAGKIASTRKFLIATHGSFALGIKSSLDIIIGPMENVFIIQAYLEENKSIEEELDKVFQHKDDTDEWVIFSDLLGGSITNQVLRHGLGKNAHIISGFNLPLLIEVLLSDTESALPEIIENAISQAKEQIVYVNKLLTVQNNKSEND
jgi:mannose/fructose-specific phosphotransferase system component IIA